MAFGGAKGLCCRDFPASWGGGGLLHACAGEIRGFAAWISWGDLKGGCAAWMSGGFARWVSEGAGGRFAERLSRGSERDLLRACPGGEREGFARAEGVCWLLLHVLCTRET